MRRSDFGRFLTALLVLASPACSGRAALDYGALAETLIRESRWDEAAEAAKQQLLSRPRDAAAHFFLGRCYLNGPMFCPGPAEGEFQTALRLFKENGGESPIGEYDSEYFELRCHLELAKVYLRKFYELADRGAPKSVLRKPLRELAASAKAAETISPDSEDVRELKAIVEAL